MIIILMKKYTLKISLKNQNNEEIQFKRRHSFYRGLCVSIQENNMSKTCDDKKIINIFFGDFAFILSSREENKIVQYLYVCLEKNDSDLPASKEKKLFP